MKKILTLITAIILLSTGLGCQAQTQYVYAPKSKVNMRATPSTSGAKAGMLQKFYPVPLTAETNGWYKVDNAGNQAYISSSVSALCDASIPAELYGQDLWTQEAPADETFYEGSMTIHIKDNDKVAITREWSSMYMAAVSFVFVGSIKDGVITLTHQKYGFFDGSEPIEEMLDNAEPLEEPLYVGYNPEKKTVIFTGGVFGSSE